MSGRAEKMHDARLAWEGATERPREAEEPTLGRYHVGCSGWYYWHWAGAFYPADLPRADWFPFYADQFETVELNAPFYSWPTVATVRTWLKQAEGRRIVYTVKVSELITHVKRFSRTKTLVRDFGHIADLLGPRMGCFLFSTPTELSLLGGGAAADRGATRSHAPERRRVSARLLVERTGLLGVSRTRHHLLLLQRPASSRRAGEDRGRNLRALPRPGALVSA
jgi:hypothetical protein